MMRMKFPSESMVWIIERFFVCFCGVPSTTIESDTIEDFYAMLLFYHIKFPKEVKIYRYISNPFR